MNPVHIFRTNKFKNKAEQLEEVMVLMLSAITVKKIYGEINVITDIHGEHLIEGLGIPFDTVLTSLESGEEKVGETDALIIAFKKLSVIMPNFIYIDHKILHRYKATKKDYIVGNKLVVSKDLMLFKKMGIDFYFDIEEGQPTTVFEFEVFKCSNPDIIKELFECYFTSLYRNEDLLSKKSELYFFSDFTLGHYAFSIFKKHRVLNQTFCYNGKEKSKIYSNPSSRQIPLFDCYDKYNLNLLTMGLTRYPIEFAQLINAYKYI